MSGKRRMASRLLLVLLALSVWGVAAEAATVDSVRSAGTVRCGGVPKPGLAYPDPSGKFIGLEIDLCRAVAAAVLGDPARATFHPYQLPADFAAASSGADHVAFLDAGQMIAAGLTESLLPGPTVFYESQGVMVAAGSPARSVRDLRGIRLCVEPGTEAERGAAAWFAAHHLVFQEFPFQEQEEMIDAFTSGTCAAIIEETTTLGALAADAAAAGKQVRILPDAMAPNPLMEASPASDGAWSAMLGWVFATLVRAEQSGTTTEPPGVLRWLPLGATPAGLSPGWQARVLAAVGTHGDILRRNLGAGSRLHLPSGPNGVVEQGGLFAAPVSQ